MSEYIEAFRKAWYNDQSREKIRYDTSTHAPIWENVWKKFAEWVEKQKGYAIIKCDKRRIRVRTGDLNKEPWLFLSRDDAIKSAIYVKIVMCSDGIQVGVDFNEKEATNEKATDIYVKVFDKCFSMLNDGWQIENGKFSIYKLIEYKGNAPDEDYESDFDNLLREAIKQYEIAIEEFQNNMNTNNEIWWFSFDCIKDKVNDEAWNKFVIQFAKYKEEILTFINDESKEELCKMSTIRAGLAQKFALQYGINNNLRSTFKVEGKDPRNIKVTDGEGNSETVSIPQSVNAKTFINTTFDLFKENYTEEKPSDLIIIFKCKGEDVEGSMAYMKKLIGEANIHPYHVPHNRIVFGAPGTGKSWKIKNESTIFENRITRVTFHPEYSYYDFVGSYKPVMTGTKIGYGFVPGPFASILREALNKPGTDYCLIIEEINRARVAAVFGDIFQLLDRDSSGNSEYRIKPSEELARYLSTKDDNKGTIDGDKLKEYESNGIHLPSNLYIWATMNSADQGVYPLDTAFKRRWSMEYIPYGSEDNEPIQDLWNQIRTGINRLLLKKGHVNEDKLMGYYFLKEEERAADNFETALENKVLMYLFDDAAKPCRKDVFKEIKGARTYSSLREAMSLSKPNLGIFEGDPFWPVQPPQNGQVNGQAGVEEAGPGGNLP